MLIILLLQVVAVVGLVALVVVVLEVIVALWLGKALAVGPLLKRIFYLHLALLTQ
jgi:hypothetical protein